MKIHKFLAMEKKKSCISLFTLLAISMLERLFAINILYCIVLHLHFV